MNILEIINKIRTAVYGRDVRDSIANGIEAIYYHVGSESDKLKEAEHVAETKLNQRAAEVQAMIDTAADYAANVSSAVSEVQGAVDQVNQNTAALTTKLTKPTSDGTAGQVLQANGDGTSVWADAMTEIKDGTITPEKTSFFTKSDIEYEIVESKKINAYGTGLAKDDNCFTVFIKIPVTPFAYIAVNANNTENNKTCTANADKANLKNYGFTDINKNKATWTENRDNFTANLAEYFVVSYKNETNFEIEVGAVDYNINNVCIPVANTELGADFFVQGDNKITGLKDVCYSSNGWRYTGRLRSNLFKVENGKKLYHNGGNDLFLWFFDNNYNAIKSANFKSGTKVEVENAVFAYAWLNNNSVKDNLWIADKDLSADSYKSNRVINPELIPTSNNLSNSYSPFLFDVYFKNQIDDVTMINGYSETNRSDSGYTMQTGFENKLTIGKLCVCDDISVKAIVSLVDTNCNVIMGSSAVYGGSRCSLVQFDFASGQIKIAPANDGTAIPDTVLQTTDMSVAVDSNLKYILEVGRKKRELYAKITNYTTGTYIESIVSEDNLNNYKYPAGWLYDEPMIALDSGNVTIERFYAQVKQYDIAILGDSITEGYGLPYKSCFASKIKSWVDKSCVIMGRAGGQITCSIRQCDDILSHIAPKIVIITIGTNNGNTISNITTLLYKIRQLGAAPVINHIPMMSNANSSKNVNSVIEAFGEHGARFDIATAIDNDIDKGIDTSLYQADRLHPNTAGHNKCFERFKLDCDFLGGTKNEI